MHNFKKSIKVLKNKAGNAFVGVMVKVIIGVVIGALTLGGLYIVADNSLDVTDNKVSSLFEAEPANSGSGGHDGAGSGFDATKNAKITIDGTEEIIEKQGDNIVLPDKTDEDFVCFKGSDGKLYPAGSTVAADANNSYDSVTLDLTTYKYELNTSSAAKYGIRWSTQMDENQLNEIKASGATVDIGTFIAPESYLVDSDFNINYPTKKMNIAYSGSLLKQNNVSYFNATMGNVKDANANVKFAARGYAKITYSDAQGNAIEKYIYAKYKDNNRTNICTTIAKLSVELKNNADAYAACSSEVKTKVDHYASLYTE